MGNDNNKNLVCVSPRWANFTIAIIGFVIALLGIVSACTLFYSQGWNSVLNGICYLILSSFIIFSGVMIFVYSFKKNNFKMLSCSFLIGAAWCLLGGFASLFTAFAYMELLSYGYEVTTYIVLSLLLGLLYISSAVFLMITGHKLEKKRGQIKVLGAIGSISFATIALLNFISVCVSSYPDTLSILLCLTVLFLAAMLIFLTFKSEIKQEEEKEAGFAGNNDENVPENYSHFSHDSEDDKIRHLKEYKELLDSGAISQEEYDKKKSEILS